jgi:P4 family phage/plasmid primase-like protien
MLHEKTTLIGFENGVYDLDTREFRKGAPEDMLTFSTRINYIEFDPSDPVYESIFSFFNSVQPDNDLRTYLLKFLASCLNGTVREHSFHIAQGIGSNGKSLTIEFFEKAFGDYAVKLPVAFLTQKRGHSGAANPEVIRLKGKRFACLQEPGNDERLNVGLMKEVTGGDTIVARGLYKDCIEIKPQFRLVLTANNLPEVPSADGGTWRRIKLLPFGSRFVENPNPDKPNEFQIDYDLSGKLGKLAPYFLSYLIELYYDYKETGNPPPAQVTAATEQYKRMSDHFQAFVEKFIEMDSDSSIVIDDLFELYKDFMMDQNKGARVKRQDFILNIKTVLRFEGNDYDTGYGGKIKKVVNKEPGFVTA